MPAVPDAGHGPVRAKFWHRGLAVGLFRIWAAPEVAFQSEETCAYTGLPATVRAGVAMEVVVDREFTMNGVRAEAIAERHFYSRNKSGKSDWEAFNVVDRTSVCPGVRLCVSA